MHGPRPSNRRCRRGHRVLCDTDAHALGQRGPRLFVLPPLLALLKCAGTLGTSQTHRFVKGCLLACLTESADRPSLLIFILRGKEFSRARVTLGSFSRVLSEHFVDRQGHRRERSAFASAPQRLTDEEPQTACCCIKEISFRFIYFFWSAPHGVVHYASDEQTALKVVHFQNGDRKTINGKKKNAKNRSKTKLSESCGTRKFAK